MCTRSLSALVVARSFLEVMTSSCGYVSDVLGATWGTYDKCFLTYQVWDVASGVSGTSLYHLQVGHEVQSVGFSPDGSKVLAVADKDVIVTMRLILLNIYSLWG